MEAPRLLARTLVVNEDKVLLVRNKDADYWYLPGGGYRMLWLQEFHQAHQIFFETFWLAHLSDDNEQTETKLQDHIDIDPEGIVVEARWFSESDLSQLTVYPERVKNFGKHIAEQANIEDPFLGTFK
jgi:hypothetical protein